MGYIALAKALNIIGGDEIGTDVAIGDFAAYVVDVQTP